MMRRQLVLISKEEMEAQKIERRRRLDEQHAQYKQSYKMRRIATLVLYLILTVILYLISITLFANQSQTKIAGSVASGAAAARQERINSAEDSFTYKYFNIQW
jgi:cytochrome c-type biogenesis protein CcmH/NrfG